MRKNYPITKHFFFLFLLVVLSANGFAQVAGDFRSTGSTAWNLSTTWQRFNGTTWESSGTGSNNPGKIPGVTAGATGNVTIQSGHIISFNTSPAFSIASLTLAGSGALSDAAGHTLNVTGAVTMDGAGASYIEGSGTTSAAFLTFNCASINIGTVGTSTVQIGTSGQGVSFNCTGAMTLSANANLSFGTGLGSGSDNTISGTITATLGSTTVTGSGTSFTTQLAVGSLIFDNTGIYCGTIASIASNTSLTLTAVPVIAIAGASCVANLAPLRKVGSLTVNTGATLATTAPVRQSVLKIIGDWNLYGNVTCAAAGTSPCYVVGGNLHTWSGSAIGTTGSTTQLLTINVLGTMTAEVGGNSSIGFVTLNVYGTTTVNGTLQFSGSSQGTKTFKSITISSTGTWNDAVGESVTVNGNIINNGSWDGCSGGTCTYTFGSVSGTYSVTGNPISMSILSVSASTILNNNGTISLDGGIANILTGTGTFNNLATGVLFLQGGAGGVIVNVTTFNATTSGNTVYYSQAANQQIRTPTDGGYYNLDCSNGGTKTFQTAGTIAVTGTCTIEDVTIFNVSTNTLNGAGGLTMTGTSQLIISKCSGPTLPELTGSYSLTGGTIVLNGACAQTLNTTAAGATTYGGLTISGSFPVTVTGVTMFNGDITISGTGTMTGNSAFTQDCSHTFTISSTSGTTTLANNITIGKFSHTGAGILNDGGKNITVCGSTWNRTVAKINFVPSGRVLFTASGGTCAITSSAVANITQFKNITISSGTTLTGDVNGMEVGLGGSADWTCDGVFTHNSGTVTTVGNTSVLGTATTTFNNITINAATTLIGHATNMIVQGNWINNNAFTHNSGTVTLTGGNAQTITGNTTFYNLTVAKTTATIATQSAATITVNNLFTMTDGVYSTGTNTLSGTAGFTATGGDLQMATISTVPGLTGATYAITGGTVTLNGAGAQTLRTSAATGGNTYYNLLFTTSGVKTITGLTVINGDATINGTATLAANSGFAQAASKTFTYASTAGTSTLTAATAVSVGNFIMNGAGGGTLDINGNTFTVKGNWTKSAETFTNAGTSRVVFNGSGLAQTFTDNGTTITRVTINNASGLTLSNDITISTDLTFTSGNITTGINNAILSLTTATVTGAGQGIGFVDGNFRKILAAGASNRTFEIGTTGNYTPIAFVFTACGGGNMTCTTINGDHPIIANSTFDPSTTVNLNWQVNNNSAGAITYSATFYYQAANKDAGFDYTQASVIRYISPLWNATTIGTKNTTDTQITGESSPSNGTSEYYQIGNDYVVKNFYNRLSNGTFSWSNKATWIKNLTGTVTFTLLSTTVTGVGTNFQADLVVGDIIMLQSTPGTTYTVASIDPVLQQLTTTFSVALSGTGPYGKEAVPGAADFVNIGNTNVNTGNTIIQMDIAAPASINRLELNAMSNNYTLTHTTANTLTILTTAVIQQGTAKLNTWDIAAGNVLINGNVTIGNAVNTANTYNAKISVSTGTLEILSNLLLEGGSAANAVNATLAFSGAGTLKLGGTFNLDNGTSPYFGTFTPGASSTVNYNGVSLIQTINLNSTAPAVTYANIATNNTYSTGIVQPANLDQTGTIEISGNLSIQSGIYNNGGFSIVGAAAKTFSVSNGATFNMTGTSVYPSGFGTHTFGATSNTYYKQTSNPQAITAVASPGYGYLYLYPTVTATQQFAASTYYVQSDLTIGNSTNITTANASAATATINVAGNVVISTNATLNCSTNAMNILVGGSWTNNGGTYTPGTNTVTFNGSGTQQINGTPASQTFYNVTITKTTGGTVTTGGSTTTLTTNNLTLSATNTGTFTAPATLNINATASASSLILSGGTFVAGATINITGNWTHDNTLTAFTNNSGTINFTGTAGQTINGTNASETFYNVVESKTAGQLLNTGGSIVTLNFHDFTETTGNFTAPATVSGTDFTLTSGTYTAGANTNISGNVLFNGSTFTPGTNTVTFNGSGSQTVGGSGAIPTLYNLTLNTSAVTNQVTLNVPLTMSNLLTLTKGQLTTTSTNVLTLAAGSPTPTLPGTVDNSFINGPVNHVKITTASETFVFPIGKNNQAHRIDLIIAHSATTSTTYTGEYFFASSVALGYTLPSTCSYSSMVDYWNIDQSVGSSVTTASVKMYYYTVDYVSDPANLTILKGDPSLWADIGGVGSGTPTGTITSTINFTNFSRFAYGNRLGGTNLLPIQLTAFDAKANSSSVGLNWTTATEINNQFFTIERSADAVNFTPIAYINSLAVNGNSNSVLNYFTSDDSPLKGLSYYRLKQTDYNGDFAYSQIVSVEFMENSNIKFIVYPNPSQGQFNVDFSGIENNHEMEIVMYDQQGKLVYYNKLNSDSINSGSFKIVPDHSISAGIYIVNFIVEGIKYPVRVIVN